MQPPDQHNEQSDTIHRLAEGITRVGLHAPFAMALDVIKPLDFVSSQVALFLQPFVRGHAWEQYMTALSDESHWQALRHELDRQQHERDADEASSR